MRRGRGRWRGRKTCEETREQGWKWNWRGRREFASTAKMC